MLATDASRKERKPKGLSVGKKVKAETVKTKTERQDLVLCEVTLEKQNMEEMLINYPIFNIKMNIECHYKVVQENKEKIFPAPKTIEYVELSISINR